MKSNKGVYDQIINLPFITSLPKFEYTINSIKESGALSKKQLEYLDFKLQTKDFWAKCLIKNNFVAGVSTTSRVESLHSVLKKRLNPRSRLCEVLSQFRSIERAQIQLFKEEFTRHTKTPANHSLNKDALLTELKALYSPYAIDKVSKKLDKCLLYRHEAISDSLW